MRSELKEHGYDRGMVSMQGLGYKEILDYLDDKITLEEAIYRIKTGYEALRQAAADLVSEGTGCDLGG